MNQLIDFVPVDKPVVGQSYHVSWSWSKGCVWRCTEINEETGTVTLMTPKTKRKMFNIKISDLRHTRKNQYKISKSQ